MDGPHILLVEDDAQISHMLADVLAESGFDTATAATAADMDAVLGRGSIDLILLDIMLPDEDGLSICRRLRASSGIPIIMLTALKEDVDRIAGLEIGADDYVTKPFNSRELVARIRALLRRTQADSLPHERPRLFRFAGWCVDPAARQVHNPDGLQVSMTSAEFDLLVAFCSHPGRILTREQILALTHGGLAGPVARSIDVHVSRLRQKIEADPREPALIKTVRLGGYVFSAEVDA